MTFFETRSRFAATVLALACLLLCGQRPVWADGVELIGYETSPQPASIRREMVTPLQAVLSPSTLREEAQIVGERWTFEISSVQYRRTLIDAWAAPTDPGTYFVGFADPEGSGDVLATVTTQNPSAQLLVTCYQPGYWRVQARATLQFDSADWPADLPRTSTLSIDLTVFAVTSVEVQAIDSPLSPSTGCGTPGSDVGLQINTSPVSPTDTVDRSRLRVLARITPPLAGAQVWFKDVDVDDLSANTAPIDDEESEFDNYGLGLWESASGVTDDTGTATTVYRISGKPGDNVVLVADGEPEYLATLRNVDANGDGLQIFEYSGEERCALLAFGQQAPPIQDKVTLWIELDSMEAEPNGQPFPADDALRGDVPDPDVGGLAELFAKASIVPQVTEAQGFNTPTAPWRHDFVGDMAGMQDYFNAANGVEKITVQTRGGWVYVCGIYENGYEVKQNEGDGKDNDDPDGGNTEVCETGMTYPNEPEFSCVMMEVVRDVVAEHNWGNNEKARIVRYAVAHEICHQFEIIDHDLQLVNGKPASVMWVPTAGQAETENLIIDVPNKLSDEQLRHCRNTPP